MPRLLIRTRESFYSLSLVSKFMVFAACLVFHAAQAQKPGFVKNNKHPNYGMYAFVDSLQPGEPVYKWEAVKAFEEGMAWVYIFDREKSEDLWGLIDVRGHYIVEPRYNSFSSFREDYCRVSKNGKFGFINRAGQEIIKTVYDTATSFSDGLAFVRLKKKWKIIDKAGSIVRDIQANYSSVGQFREGLCEVTNLAGLDGYIDVTGKEVIPCTYKYARAFKDGKAYVEKVVNVYGKTKAGIIDKTGTPVVPFHYDGIEEFKNGLALVYNRSKTSDLSSSMYGLITETGQELLPTNYSAIEVLFSKWIWGLTYYDRKVELRDLEGKLISAENFEMKSYPEGYYIIRVNDKYAVYGRDEKERIPLKYDYIGEFKAGLAEVRSGSKWGYINMNDSMVIPLKFDEAAPFSGDTALVVLNSKKYNLARNGNLSEFRIDSLKFTYTTYPHFVFGGNLKGQWHVSSLNGNTVSLLYDRLERKGYDFFIGFNKKKQTVFIMGETATQKIEVPLEPGNRIVQYFGWAPDQDLCGVTRVNGKYGMYNVSNGSEVPAGFSEFKASGIGCQFKYNDEWYDVSGRNSDFSKNVYALSATCSACKGTGGTSGRKIKVRIEGEKRYVPSSTKSVKSFEYATLPNGEKSKFITYTVYKEETVPGHYEKEPDTYVDEWEPGIPCTSCKGKGNHPMTVKWTGTGFETIH